MTPDPNGWQSGFSSVTTAGWLELNPVSGVESNYSIGVAFDLVASDERGPLAFDDFRGAVASDGTFGPPP